MTMSRILIVKGKHGDAYYDVSDDELLHKTCCKILKKRLDEGWYGPYCKTPALDKDVPAWPVVEAMKEGPVKDAMVKLHKDYQRKLREYTDEQSFLDDLDTVLKMEYDPDAKPAKRRWAYGLLESRGYYEYESVELEYAEKIE
jgi:hypothetical protein